jgi:hypothetical protein
MSELPTTDPVNKRWRKKPVVIEAMQVPLSVLDRQDGKPYWEALLAWLEDCDDWAAREYSVVIGTLEGEMRADPGDWIIKGVKGEFYPCKPDIFEATYDRA